MDLISWSLRVLEDAGYSIRSERNKLLFEDETIYGFISAHENVDDIIHSWESIQDGFLKEHAPAIRRSNLKAWNAYSVFLTSSEVDYAQQGFISNIEEDFRSTRKIVRAGVTSLNAVRRALFSLLPIQHPVQLSSEDMKERIFNRMTLSLSVKAALLSNSSLNDILAIIDEEV